MTPDLPNNHEAETGALGACLVNPDSMTYAATVLTPEQFYLEKHGLIWRAMLSLDARREPISIKTTLFELKAQQQLDAIGGLAYLSELTEHSISTHIEAYAAEVERCAVLRSLIRAGGTIASTGYTATDAEAALAYAQLQLANVAMRRIGSGLLPSSAAADREYQRLERANEGQPPASGVLTGFCDLDELLLGFHDSEVTIVAARPSVGKTAFLLSLAHGVTAASPERDVLIFSLEMGEEQLRFRRLAMLSRLDTMRIRTLRLSEHDQQAYMAALAAFAPMPVFIDDTPAMSASAIRGACHRHQAQHRRPLLVMIDYLQLMTAPEVKEGNRVQVVGAISRALKALAKELHCPIVALSQLSRAVEGRSSHIPVLSDLRETGDIEQDSDVVLFLYREELYDKETDKKGVTEVHIAKHRNGPIGVIPMRFDASTTSFQTLTWRSPFGGPPFVGSDQRLRGAT